MMWLVLILACVIAVPLVQEYNRRDMDDAARGIGAGQLAELPQGVTHYEWHGPVGGPVLVCVHGLTTPSFVWRGLTAGLAVLGFRVLTYDLFGRGHSDRPKGAQDAGFFMRQLADLMTHQQVRGKVTLVGYSMGGAIVTSFAAAHPNRVEQVILLAPAGMRHGIGGLVRLIRDVPWIGDWLMLALYPRMMRQGIEAERALPSSVLNIGDLQEAELDFKNFVPAVLASLRGILRRPLKSEHQQLRDAKTPVLAIWGKDDSVIPLSALGTLAEWNRNVQHEVIDGAGHGLTYTHSDAVLAIVTEWAKVPPPPPMPIKAPKAQP